MSKPLEGRLTIAKVTGDGQHIEVRIECGASSIEFVTLKLTLEDLTRALTGQSGVKGEIETRGLDKVGKTMLHRKFEFPFKSSDYGEKRRQAARLEVLNHCPDGWEPDLGFNSQDSFDTDLARTMIRKWK